MLKLETSFFLAATAATLSLLPIRQACAAEVSGCKEVKGRTERMACIESEKQRALKEKEVADFVSRAKDKLTETFKDPASAQYRNLFLVDGGQDKTLTLCGFVNSKNSYGGYVGFVPFYVHYSPNYDGDGLQEWIDDGREKGELAISGRNLAKAYCTAGQRIEIPKN